MFSVKSYEEARDKWTDLCPLVHKSVDGTCVNYEASISDDSIQLAENDRGYDEFVASIDDWHLSSQHLDFEADSSTVLSASSTATMSSFTKGSQSSTPTYGAKDNAKPNPVNSEDLLSSQSSVPNRPGAPPRASINPSINTHVARSSFTQSSTVGPSRTQTLSEPNSKIYVLKAKRSLILSSKYCAFKLNFENAHCLYFRSVAHKYYMEAMDRGESNVVLEVRRRDELLDVMEELDDLI